MGATATAFVYAPPILDAGEQILYFMPLAIEVFVEFGGEYLPSRRDEV
jgi:hypothetical protein